MNKCPECDELGVILYSDKQSAKSMCPKWGNKWWWDKIQSSTPTMKSCYNCNFYDGKKCINKQLGLVPLDQRDPPYTTVIKEDGCELFQSSASTARSQDEN